MNRLIRSFGYAFKGLFLALKTEQNLKIHLLATILVLGAGFFLGVSLEHWMILVLCIGAVWCLELVNTAIERLVDLVHPEQHPKAGDIKDIAASAVVVAAVVSIIIALFVFVPYLQH